MGLWFVLIQTVSPPHVYRLFWNWNNFYTLLLKKQEVCSDYGVHLFFSPFIRPSPLLICNSSETAVWNYMIPLYTSYFVFPSECLNHFWDTQYGLLGRGVGCITFFFMSLRQTFGGILIYPCPSVHHAVRPSVQITHDYGLSGSLLVQILNYF